MSQIVAHAFSFSMVGPQRRWFSTNNFMDSQQKLSQWASAGTMISTQVFDWVPKVTTREWPAQAFIVPFAKYIYRFLASGVGAHVNLPAVPIYIDVKIDPGTLMVDCIIYEWVTLPYLYKYACGVTHTHPTDPLLRVSCPEGPSTAKLVYGSRSPDGRSWIFSPIAGAPTLVHGQTYTLTSHPTWASTPDLASDQPNVNILWTQSDFVPPSPVPAVTASPVAPSVITRPPPTPLTSDHTFMYGTFPNLRALMPEPVIPIANALVDTQIVTTPQTKIFSYMSGQLTGLGHNLQAVNAAHAQTQTSANAAAVSAFETMVLTSGVHAMLVDVLQILRRLDQRTPSQLSRVAEGLAIGTASTMAGNNASSG